ncbi:uncharacterized protein LOC107270840 [Cephus cinctus]|uniref:Uncharacterized protein LOC107270840 n=1 Tax=Cephus cinctus TaxID=211228 RepID=A0AAJ7C4I7_CEPCN|nr:uncharacterized protein LOC107270840 [Cephus cinctus]
MAFRNIFRTVVKKATPIIYASSPIIVNCAASKKPPGDKKITLEPPEHLSYDYMIKQSTIQAVNSATQALTVTYIAIETTSQEYRYLLSQLIVLIQETLTYEVSDSHWDHIVKIRSEVQEKKLTVMQLISFMDYVHKMAVAASEISYLSDMENLSTTLCQRIDDALSKMQKEITNNQILEDEYRLIQQKSIMKSNVKHLYQETKNDEAPAEIINID